MAIDRRNNDRRQVPDVVVAERRGKERRQSDRRSTMRAPLDLWVEEEKGGNELYFRRTGNVSTGGIYFEQSIPHALGTVVKLRFSLPGSEAVIEATGEIVNTPTEKDGLGMGLRFLELGAEDRASLEAFTKQRD
jgi:uncharacterized protein (TIGR02266 family)